MVSIYQQASTHLTASEDRLMDIMDEGIKWRIQKEPRSDNAGSSKLADTIFKAPKSSPVPFFKF